MNKLHKEIAEKLFIISNDLLADYYGISPHPWEIEEVLLKNHRGASWTPEGWKVPSDLYLQRMKLERLPKIAPIIGDFDCRHNALKTLEGSPPHVYGIFNCAHNKLVSLLEGPALVDDDYLCHDNELKSLKGAPEVIYGIFSCVFNRKLKNLIGAPRIAKSTFECGSCGLETLKGSPKEVHGYFGCTHNNLINLDHGPKYIRGALLCRDNPFDPYPPVFKGILKGPLRY